MAWPLLLSSPTLRTSSSYPIAHTNLARRLDAGIVPSERLSKQRFASEWVWHGTIDARTRLQRCFSRPGAWGDALAAFAGVVACPAVTP